MSTIAELLAGITDPKEIQRITASELVKRAPIKKGTFFITDQYRVLVRDYGYDEEMRAVRFVLTAYRGGKEVRVINPVLFRNPGYTVQGEENPEEAIKEQVIRYLDTRQYGSTIDGHTTLVVYSYNLGTSYVGGWTGDGIIHPETWSNTRNATGTAVDAIQHSHVSVVVVIYSDSEASPGWLQFARGVLFFDTSELPDTSIISGATLTVKTDSAHAVVSYYGGQWRLIAHSLLSPYSFGQHDWNDPTFAARWGSTQFSTAIDFDDTAPSTAYQLALNAAGIAYISKTGDTIFGLIESHDADNDEPTPVAGKSNVLWFSSTNADHFLTIEYYDLDVAGDDEILPKLTESLAYEINILITDGILPKLAEGMTGDITAAVLDGLKPKLTEAVVASESIVPILAGEQVITNIDLTWG
jgi:hypothetical protein